MATVPKALPGEVEALADWWLMGSRYVMAAEAYPLRTLRRLEAARDEVDRRRHAVPVAERAIYVLASQALDEEISELAEQLTLGNIETDEEDA